MNTLTTKDVAQVARRPHPAYDFFGAGWAISNDEKRAMEPVSRFGISDLGLGFLEESVLGIPIWILAAAGVAAFVWPGFLKD